ncbi:MAG TPA: YajD family HNH nuclease [Burkholderiales bacterium]|nr:YajD family HNH nuclease [Burkholderiales bacterium]
MRRLPPRRTPDPQRLDRVVADARRRSDERARSYREQALKVLPWICTRCAREFGGERLRELTVHHKDGNHDNNPADGSNWELLCIYCHENEHARVLDSLAGGSAGERDAPPATHRPLEGLAERLRDKRK